MLNISKILNTENLDLNFNGMVVSMADGVASIICLLELLIGEVQGLIKQVVFRLNFCLNIFVCNLLNNELESNNTNLYVEYIHFFVWILLAISILYVLISTLYLMFGGNVNYYLEHLYKSLIFLVINLSVFVLTLPNLFFNLKFNYFYLINNLYENGNINNFTIFALVVIPFIFFILTILFTSYNVKLFLNNNYSGFFNHTWLYILIWISSFYCLYRFSIFDIVLSLDKSIHSEFVSVFLTKFHFRIFIMSLFLPLSSLIFVFILKLVSYFKIDVYNKFVIVLNNNIKSIAFQKWYIRITVLFFVSIFYAIITVYGYSWEKPWNLVYIYKDFLAVLSSLFIFPAFNVGRIIFSGTVVSRSGNFEVGLLAKKLIKSFNRQYSIYPNGSPQYRLMERKAKALSKLTSKGNVGNKLLLEKIAKVENKVDKVDGKVNIIADQTSYINGVKTGATVTVGLATAADLFSKEPKIPKFIKESIKDVKIDSDKIN